MDHAYAGEDRIVADRTIRRRRAFELNLKANIDTAFGDSIHPVNRGRLIRALGAAHAKTRHMMDARTAFGIFGLRYYCVLQGGIAPVRSSLAPAGPLALAVLGNLDPQTLDDFTDKERSMIAECVDQAEITRMHPFDWRPRLSLRFRSIYFNVLAGRDRRHAELNVGDDRRFPSSDAFGSAVLFTLVLIAAGLGLWFLVEAVFMMADALADPVIWNLLFSGVEPDPTALTRISAL